MKRIISLILIFIMLSSLFVACKPADSGKVEESETSGAGESSSTEVPVETPIPEDLLVLATGGRCSYAVVRPELCDDTVMAAAQTIRKALVDLGAKDASIKEDFLYGGAQPAQYEILVGQTNREESARVLETAKYNDYFIAVDGDKIIINSYNSEQVLAAAELFASSIEGSDGELTFSSKNTASFKGEYLLEDIKIGDKSLLGYRIVQPVSSSAFVKNIIIEFQQEVLRLSGIYLPIVGDTRAAVEKELLFGNTKHLAVAIGGLGQYGYEIKAVDEKIVIVTSDNDYTLVKTMEMIFDGLAGGSVALVKDRLPVSDAPILTSMCFSDVHNNFAMLEPNNSSGDYVVRRNVDWIIDLLLETEGAVDVVMVGGDYMSDYPSWNSSGRLPYSYYLGYKQKTIETFNRLTKDGKVMYAAGNHDYAQGEAGKGGPGKMGSYNSFDFYFDGPMDETLGVLADEDKLVKVGTHTGEEYLLAYYYRVNGIHFIGFSPDPDLIWSEQGYGFTKEQFEWLDNKLDEIDPKGTEVIFVNCHYAMAQRVTYRALNAPVIDSQVTYDFTQVLSGHKNLFYMFGHWHTVDSYHKDTTVKNVLHYKADGTIMPITGKETESTEVKGAYERSFTAVWMGGFRLDWSSGNGTTNADRFNDDYVTGVYTHESTGTPRMAQGMYIEVYPDRVVFQMKNVGDYPGYTTEDIIEPYTVYLYK